MNIIDELIEMFANTGLYDNGFIMSYCADIVVTAIGLLAMFMPVLVVIYIIKAIVGLIYDY